MSEFTDEIKERIAYQTGLTEEKLDDVLAGMVETYGIRERYRFAHDDESVRKFENWDYYLAGSNEVLARAGASFFDIEQLVAVMYDEQQRHILETRNSAPGR